MVARPGRFLDPFQRGTRMLEIDYRQRMRRCLAKCAFSPQRRGKKDSLLLVTLALTSHPVPTSALGRTAERPLKAEINCTHLAGNYNRQDFGSSRSICITFHRTRLVLGSPNEVR
jgi:hypothetical protein